MDPVNDPFAQENRDFHEDMVAAVRDRDVDRAIAVMNADTLRGRRDLVVLSTGRERRGLGRGRQRRVRDSVATPDRGPASLSALRVPTRPGSA